MNVLRSKAEQVADILRAAMARGELREPLPTVRAWSSQWGVSLPTCQAALNILKREGWIRSRPGKGLSLGRDPSWRVPTPVEHAPVVRWLTRSPRLHFVTSELLGTLSRMLADHNVGLRVEIVDAARVADIIRGGERAREEALMLADLPPLWQSRFADFRNALQIGLPIPGIRLPYLTLDVLPALRHAVYGLFRQGFTRISFLPTGERRCFAMEGEFRQICSLAPHSIHSDVIRIPGAHRITEQRQAVQRLVARIRVRHGFVTNRPELASLLPMTVMKNGLKVPEDVEVAVLQCTPTQAAMLPWVTHYPYPLERICRTLCHAAMRCCSEGAMPKLHAAIPIEMLPRSWEPAPF